MGAGMTTKTQDSFAYQLNQHHAATLRAVLQEGANGPTVFKLADEYRRKLITLAASTWAADPSSVPTKKAQPR